MRTKVESILLDPKRVRPFVRQPRIRFRNIPELMTSIKHNGQSTPIQVKPAGDDPSFDYELIDGERRLRACTLLGIKIKAWVRKKVGTLAEQRKASASANFGHEPHDCMEIAILCKAFRDEDNMTLEEIGNALGGKSTNWVSQHLNLLKLDPAVQALLVESEEDGPPQTNGDAKPRTRKLTFSLAQLLVPFPAKDQIKDAGRIIEKDMSLVEARRYIHQQARKAGSIAGTRGRAPAEHADSLLRLTDHSVHSFGIYLDMKSKEFDAITRSVIGPKRKDLAQKLHRLANDIETMAIGFD